MTDKRNLALATRLLPWLVLVAMLTVTWWLWDHERQSSHKALRSQFDFVLRESVSRVEQRESAYEQMLRGVQGLFSSTDLMSRKAFHDYVETLQLDANFSGIQGFGVIQWVSAEHRERHLATMRHLGMPGYALKPPGDRDSYTPIIQSFPDVGRYRDIIGIDSWVDPVRRRAMERARDSGMPAITEKLRLAVDREHDDPPPSFVMYLPIFERGKALNSIAQRRAHLLGWVYASFYMNDFMASLYGKQPPGLSLAIYDGTDPSGASLMYQAGMGGAAPSATAAFSAQEYMVVAGHTWMLSLSTQAEFEARFQRNIDRLIAVIGVCLSLSMALLVWFMVAGRAHAIRLADQMTQELRHMAQHDPLTGLPNRALFSDRVQQKLVDTERRGDRIALIFIDLDEFKPINDRHGHAVGDLLLKQVAVRLSKSVRASDTVGRLGGDEFVVLIGDLSDVAPALRLAEKIRLSVSLPFMVNARELRISCSIGVAVSPDDGEDEASLTRSADQAMYAAKGSGRNSVRLAAAGRPEVTSAGETVVTGLWFCPRAGVGRHVSCS